MKIFLSVTIICMICISGAGCARNAGSVSQSETAGIDINLPEFSRTMAHSAVIDMLTNPEAHLGKTVRARGEYATMHYDPQRVYNFLIVDGPPGCCPQGLMFIWYNDNGYEYPEIGTRIEITGTFSSYQGFSFPYNYLAIDDFIILN